MGIGMGLTMAPATEAIMGSLPKAKAGIGSAMNDVVREVGGTLGVAVLGSVLSSGYASGMDGADVGPARRTRPRRRATASGPPTRSPPTSAARAGAHLDRRRERAFIDAMASAATVGAAVAAVGALIALAFLPAREKAPAAEPAAVGAARAGARPA